MPQEKRTLKLDENLRNKNAALKAENLKLQRRIIIMEAQMISAQNKIVALRERFTPAQLTDDELQDAIRQEKTGKH